MNLPKWLKGLLFAVFSGVIAGLAVKNPVVFTGDVQASLIAAFAAYLGYHTNGETPS